MTAGEIVLRQVYDSYWGGSALEVSIKGSTDKITINGFFYGNDPGNSYNPVQQFRFADGSIWNTAAILARLSGGATDPDGTTGSTTRRGVANDALHRPAGDDTPSGDAGGNTPRGDEADTLDGGADADAPGTSIPKTTGNRTSAGDLPENDPAGDDDPWQFPLTAGGILDVTTILARLSDGISSSTRKGADGDTPYGGYDNDLYRRDPDADTITTTCDTVVDLPLNLVGISPTCWTDVL